MGASQASGAASAATATAAIRAVLFEGVPTYPDAGRCWEVTTFYTAPTLIRTLMAAGDAHVTRHRRDSIRILGTVGGGVRQAVVAGPEMVAGHAVVVGEPINPEAWRWYYEVVGGARCAVVDTWWQTETGCAMISPLPGATPTKPGSATFPFFGVEPAILDDKGNELEGPCQGYLVIKRPWPAMLRTLAGDHARFEQTYFAHFKASQLIDSLFDSMIMGRVDDVINVSGHRIGTAEVKNRGVESALVEHPACAEAAVVPIEHPIKGQAIYAFVTLMEGHTYPAGDEVRQALVTQVRKSIGPIATPDVIHWAPGLPKTRSGKIMRRILRKIASQASFLSLTLESPDRGRAAVVASTRERAGVGASVTGPWDDC
eukprot:scaffold5.g852.t1